MVMCPSGTAVFFVLGAASSFLGAAAAGVFETLRMRFETMLMVDIFILRYSRKA
jgi:hypothetical protein